MRDVPGGYIIAVTSYTPVVSNPSRSQMLDTKKTFAVSKILHTLAGCGADEAAAKAGAEMASAAPRCLRQLPAPSPSESRALLVQVNSYQLLFRGDLCTENVAPTRKPDK